MNKNVMCVCVSRDTTNIGFYELDVFEDKIDTIKLEDWNEVDGLKPKDVVDLIFDLCDGANYHMLIIDIRGLGMAVADELEKVREFDTPIYKATLDRSCMNKGILSFRDYIKDKKFIVGEDIDIDLSKFKYKVHGNGMLNLDSNEYKNEFRNIVQMLSFAEDCVLNNKRIKNKTIIEKNLREILEILVDDLQSTDKSNVGAVNDLVRLIDKVNYIRGQY